MTLGALLNGLAVLMPWGPAVQAAGAALAWIGLGLLGGSLVPAEPTDSWILSWMHADEADIAATLLKVTETLSTHLGAPDMLEQVNRLSQAATGCDWSSTFLFDPERGVYRLAANVGSRDEVRESLRQTDFAASVAGEVAEAEGGDELPHHKATKIIGQVLAEIDAHQS